MYDSPVLPREEFETEVSGSPVVDPGKSPLSLSLFLLFCVSGTSLCDLTNSPGFLYGCCFGSGTSVGVSLIDQCGSFVFVCRTRVARWGLSSKNISDVLVVPTCQKCPNTQVHSTIYRM